MNVAYINPFLTATTNVFQTMVKMPIRLGKPCLRDESQRLYKLCPLSAVIALSGAANGVVVMCLTPRVALTMASALAGRTFEKVDDEVRDALGEIVNMIAGSAKKDLPGGLVTISTPRLVDTAQVAYPAGRPVISIPFDTSVGRFIIEVSLKEEAAAQSPSSGGAAQGGSGAKTAASAGNAAAPAAGADSTKKAAA